MIFDVYKPHTNAQGKTSPDIHPMPMEWSQIKQTIFASQYVKEHVNAYRAGSAAAKVSLPAVCFVGRTDSLRRADLMKPTQLVMIDIDHCENPQEAWKSIFAEMKEKMGDAWVVDQIMLAHVSCSGKGLRIVFRAQEGKTTLKDNMEWFNDSWICGRYGEYDSKVKDYARLSFVSVDTDILFESVHLYTNTEQVFPSPLTNDVNTHQEKALFTSEPIPTNETPEQEKEREKKENEEFFTQEERAKYDAIDFRGTIVSKIVAKYVESLGRPSSGEIHNYYNEMVKNFRTITSNNKRALLYLLPRFGHTIEECFSQITSICRVNTLSSLPRDFYFFMRDNGFYQPKESEKTKQLKEFMLNDEPQKKEYPPYLPPVFREYVKSAPEDFIMPVIDALLPIMGTLTSYAEAIYPYDNRVHTTSFFSIIYAPPGTGKGFVDRMMDELFEDLRLRDLVQSARESVFLRIIRRKGDNEKAPEQPHTSLRIIPAKNSEAEFLEKQRENKGYHMFTFAAEMDSWAKGAKAAGGNKDDMIRIAWDNGEYGQQFKSPNTFKGTTRLYWNVLITGTINQIERYFDNVENGLVTRCSFVSIDNQEFKEAAVWKTINKKGHEVIKKFMERCDQNTYEEPCEIDPSLIETVSDENFDKEIKWRFTFKKKQMFDCSWIMPVIDAFHREQIKISMLDVDHARDVFRRRVGVRGFRLALMCMCLWENPTKAQLDKCKLFINWWMHKDLENMLTLWGSKYNTVADVTPNLYNRSVYEQLPERFSKSDIYVICTKQGIKSPLRQIIYSWRKYGFIAEVAKNEYKKVKKNG